MTQNSIELALLFMRFGLFVIVHGFMTMVDDEFRFPSSAVEQGLIFCCGHPRKCRKFVNQRIRTPGELIVICRGARI